MPAELRELFSYVQICHHNIDETVIMKSQHARTKTLCSNLPCDGVSVVVALASSVSDIQSYRNGNPGGGHLTFAQKENESL